MDIAWMTARPIAHRGLHDDARPENSLAAFAAGMEAGYPLELDVHLTRDNELVVVHDENLKRVTGQDLKITDCPVLGIFESTVFCKFHDFIIHAASP